MRGDHNPSEPGMIEVWCVFTSKTRSPAVCALPNEPSGDSPKIIELPSAVHCGSSSAVSPVAMASELPPSADITKIFGGCPVAMLTNAIRLPSGDHRGTPLLLGPKVSCRGSLPLTLVRHRV